MTAATRDVPMGTLGVALERRDDGSLIVRSTVPLPLHPLKLTERLEHWARVAPERTFLARRDAGGDWRRLEYGAAHKGARHVAAALIARGLSPERPIAILSGNGIEHALLSLGAMVAGVPVAPISPAYSLISSDFGKLRYILGQLRPQLVFVDDAAHYAKAVTTCCPLDTEIVATRGTLASHATTPFAALLAAPVTAVVDAAHARVGPDTIAKVLFTSGSTGVPKGVITTQAMLTANQAMLSHWLSFVAEEPPVLLDWLPWNHTFGGSHNVGLVLANGGTLYIDDGRPTPAGFAETLRNLREISPTIYFNVPKGYEELITAIRREPALRENFYRRLRVMFYSGASLPRHVWEALDAIAIEAIGAKVLMVTGFGSTETAPAALVTTHATAAAGNIGLPLPGVEIKLVPAAGKLEARIRSPSVMPGYWGEPEATAKAFDAEGYYRLGDAFRLVSEGNPEHGLAFDGRVTEDFKLATGTWVSVGPLRTRLIEALAPLARDVVIAGHDRGEIGALVFPDLDACRALASAAGAVAGATWGAAELLASDAVRAAFGTRLAELQSVAGGSSIRVMRLLLLDEMPSIDAGEITDKGSINQRAVLTRRAGLVEEMFAERPGDEVIRAP